MKKNYEEPMFNIARFTLKDALLAPSGGSGDSEDESDVKTDGNDSSSGLDPDDILG